MSIQVLKTLGDGRRYMKTWPMVRQLSLFFPEYRVIRATQIAIPVMPLLALLAAVSQLQIHGWNFLPQAITIALFFISLPVQGLLWLGWRARHPLPLSLFEWCEQLTTKLSSMGINCRPLGPKACYLDMALILKAAFEQLDNTYWEEL
ncbi:terminus macrodomain insulation protein YfbV [Shewanella sp. UCD-KL12]|uniref:terminus macrodomain insulation protein YfbV n=1 Tax=Shewanella sp. UCD-KL12 TaxID=1917163 RepID=UPI000970E33B|nr:terminus macrodomain insulation protein YfbV [Shewanella sp. UCD-KL12]